MNKRLEVIMLFSAPRTGSTNFMKELSLLENTVALDEVFHPDATYSISDDCKKYLEKGLTLKEKNYAYTHPYNIFKKIVEFYENDNQTEVLIFSIFPGHINSFVLLKLLQLFSIKVLILQRRPIDMYISQLKANKTSKYASINTTQIKVSFEVDSYLKWYMSIHGWYASNNNILSKIKPQYLFLYYEKIYSKNHRVAQFDKICGFLQRPLINEDSLSVMNKQDMNLNWFSKVADGVGELDLDFSIGYDFFNNYFVSEW